MGIGNVFKRDILRPFSPDPDDHKLSDLGRNWDELRGRDPDGSGGVLDPGPTAHQKEMLRRWGTLTPTYETGLPPAFLNYMNAPQANPLQQAIWYTPQQLQNYLSGNTLQSNSQGPSALAANSFMARLAALQQGG